MKDENSALPSTVINLIVKYNKIQSSYCELLWYFKILLFFSSSFSSVLFVQHHGSQVPCGCSRFQRDLNGREHLCILVIVMTRGLVFTCNLQRSDITKQMASCWCPPASIKSLLLIVFQRGPSASSFKLVFFSSSLANKTNFLTLSSSLMAEENVWEFGESVLFLLCHPHSTRGLLEAWRLQTLSFHFRPLSLFLALLSHCNPPWAFCPCKWLLSTLEYSAFQSIHPQTVHFISTHFFLCFQGQSARKPIIQPSRYHLNERERG